MRTPRLERAWSFVAHCLGDRGLDPACLDFEAIAALAHTHRLGSILGEPKLTASSARGLVPAALWATWDRERVAAVATAIVRGQPTKAALQAIAPVPAIVLKGAAYAELLYDVPARSMGDVDLLVPVDAFQEAICGLERAGFRQTHPRDPTLTHPLYHERELASPQLVIDLHQGFIQRERLAVDYAAIFDRSLPWPSLAANARLLAPEDAVAYHAVHAAIGQFTAGAAPSIGFVDLWMMLARRGPFWRTGPTLRLGEVPARAREWGAERMLYAFVSLARRLFPSLEGSLAALSPALPALARIALEQLIVARAYPPRIHDPPRVEVLARKALLMLPSHRLRFLGTHALRSVSP